MLSCGKDWGDISKLKVCPKIVYTVAPLPYTSGALAKIVIEQSPAGLFTFCQEFRGIAFRCQD